MADKAEIQKDWEQRILHAEQARSEWAETFRVDLARDYFRGKQNPGFPEDEWITVNKLYSHLMAQLPQLYSVDPYFYVRLKKSYQIDPDAIALAENRGQTRQAMLNYLKGELQLKTKARMGIGQAHFSYGALKVRHTAELIENKDAGKPVTDDKGDPMLDREGNEIKQPDQIPVNRRYALDWVNSEDILWDEDAGPLEDSWSFIAQRIRTPKRKAVNNPRYKTAVVKSMKGRKAMPKNQGFAKRIMQAVRKMNQDSKTRDDVEILTFWEIYDLDNRQWLTMGEDATELVADPKPLPKGVERHPYAFLRFTLLDDSPYPYPPMSPGIDPQKEYCLNRSRILVHRKRFNRKYTVIRNMLEDEHEASKLESGDDGTFVFANAHGAVEPIIDAPLDPNTTYSELSLLANELTELLGAPSQARGIANADSATEASILDARQEVKEGDRMASVTDFVLEAAKKLDFLVQEHIDRDEAVKITGTQGEFWATVRQQDYEQIEGEYEYSVNLGASRPRLPDIERSQWIAFLTQVVVPLPHILTRPNIMKRIAAMFHIEDEAALEEFRQMGLAILQGREPAPGATGGSQPRENNPVAAILGQALGPSGGNTNGGGAQVPGAQ